MLQSYTEYVKRYGIAELVFRGPSEGNPFAEQWVKGTMAGQAEEKRAEGFAGMLLWIWCHLSVFCLWSGAKIRKFQEDYEDGDLWIFFAFSLLFVVAVCVGLWTMAEVTTLIAEGNSWLKSTYYSIKNMI